MLHRLGAIEDASTTVDVLRSGILRNAKLDLECALIILPQMAPLLASEYEEHALAALDALQLLLQLFGGVIGSSRGAVGRVGVDLSAEAREQRCAACYEHLARMRPQLQRLSEAGGRTQRVAMEFLQQLDKL